MMHPLVLALLISLAINIFFFIFAYNFQTDKLTDITYAATFALLAVYFWYIGDRPDQLFKWLLMLMTVIWAIRLGTYLLRRVIVKGRDHRFDSIRINFSRYLRFWMIQATSIWLISIPTIIGLGKKSALIPSGDHPFLWIGFGFWLIGFLLESIADAQKFSFRLNPENEGQFMDKGLFSIVRFPNYLGEMMVWIGVFIFVIPVLVTWEWLSILSPIWICFLLVGLTGIPTLERSNRKRYGHMPEFQEYKANTWKLIPYIY